MNQHELDRQLDLAIDALNRESSPAPYEQGDPDVFSLVDTARLAKSLRQPAEPDPGFAELAVDRIAADLRQASTTGNGIVPSASAPTIHALPVEEPADESPRGFRSWLSRYSELAAILVVGLIVLCGILIYQTMYADDGVPAIGVPDPTGSYDLYLLQGEGELQALDPATLEDTNNTGETRHRSSGFVQSTDGSTTATIEYARRVLPHDPNLDPEEIEIVITNGGTGTERVRFHPPEHVFWPVLSNDGSRFVVLSRIEPGTNKSPNWYVFDTSDGSLLGTVEREGQFGYDVMFLGSDPDRLYRASAAPIGNTDFAGNLAIIVYDIRNGVEVDRLELTDIPVRAWSNNSDDGPETEHDLQPAVALSPDASTIAVVHAHQDAVSLIDVESLSVSTTFTYAPGDASIEHWLDRDLPQDEPLRSHGGTVSRFAVFSPDGRYLYLHGEGTGFDEDLQPMVHGFGLVVVDVGTGEVVANDFAGDRVMQVTPAPDGRNLYVIRDGDPGDDEQTLLRLDARTLDVLAERTVHSYPQISIDRSAQADDRAGDERETPPIPGDADDSGVIRNLTFEEAQELTPFELIRPAYVPERLEYLGLNLFTRPMISSDGTEQRSEPEDATLYYGLAEGELPSSMQIEFQQSRHFHGIRGDGYEESTIEISSRSIVKYHQEWADGSQHIIWTWQDGDVYYAIMALIADDETESAIEELIAALPEPEGPTPPPADGPVIAVDEAIFKRFREIQAEVDFDIAVPTFLDGFSLSEGRAGTSGPPLAPGVLAIWIDNTSQPPRVLNLNQRPDGFGNEPNRSAYDEVEDVIIQGVETVLYTRTELWQHGEELDVHQARWEMNGITYDLSSTNVGRDTFLEIAGSITPLSELEDAVFVPPPAPEIQPSVGLLLYTFEQAQEMTPFVLIQPEYIPAPLIHVGLNLSLVPDPNGDGASQDGERIAVTLSYSLDDGEDTPVMPIEFWQAMHPYDMTGSGFDESVVELAGRAITEHRQELEPRLHHAIWTWQEGDVHYAISAFIADVVTEAAIIALIEALPAPETDAAGAGPAIQDPVEFVLAYRRALEERDMDTVRSMLVERFREFDDAVLDQGVGVPFGVGDEWNPASWTAEQSEHVTVVRSNDLPVFTYVLPRGDNGDWLVDPGAHTHWNMERRANDDFDGYGGMVEGIRVERVSDVSSIDLQMLVIINLARVEVHDDDTVDVTVEWMHTRARSGEFPTDGLRWESGHVSGAAELTWTTARLSGDTAEFVALPAGMDGAATYFTTFTLYGVPDSGDLRLHVPDVTVVDAEGNEVTFSTIFHFPNAEYPQFSGESEP